MKHKVKKPEFPLPLSVRRKLEILKEILAKREERNGQGNSGQNRCT
jgi:hypothetical protein